MTIDLDQWNERMRQRWRPLRDQAGFAARRGDARAGYQDDLALDIGSAFKALVAARYARQCASGTIDPAMQVTVQPVDRVDSSIVVDAIPDGGSISLQEAAEAMIGASDNTATDLVMRAVGPDRIRDLLADLGLEGVTIPDSTKTLYEHWRTNPAQPVVCCPVTMRDLASFYQATVADRALGEPATDVFLALMREEDIVQGAIWPNDVTCYRKSGMIDPPPMLAMAMGGAFVGSAGEVTAFAFALNVPFPEDAAYEESPLEPTVRVFSEGMRRGLHELAGGESI